MIFLNGYSRTKKMDQSIDLFVESINWNSDKNLKINDELFMPTVVADKKGTVLGLAYSTKESLKLAMTTKKGIYYSRSRMEIWEKGKNMRSRQVLLEVSRDCDSDALLFIVEQRGEFCHVPGNYSCFSENIKLVEGIATKISYATGHCEKLIFELLEKIGVKVYTLPDLRSKNFIIKSDLDIPNPELISWKPKDIGLAVSSKSDIIIYYKDFMNVTVPDSEYMVLKTAKKFREMKLCLVSAKTNFGEKIRIATEYPHLTSREEMISTFGNKEVEIISTTGNSEEYVKNGFVDVAIVIVNTGKTLRDIGLKILRVIKKADLVLMVKKSYYRDHPRAIRNIRNMLESNVIYFYSVDGPHGCFSNFYPADFIDNAGRKWKSSEHYYQAFKFAHLDNKEIFEKVRNAQTAKECYKLSWANQEYFRKDWSEVKDDIMRDALIYKYQQNRDLHDILVSTGDKILVEHSLNDLHYGMGLENNGKNMLGKLLMELRAYFISNLAKL